MRVKRWSAAALGAVLAAGSGAGAQEATSITTIAGRLAGFQPSGEEQHTTGNDDGLGLLEATFRAPLGLDVDDEGNVIVADTLPTNGQIPFPGIIRIVSPLLNHPPADLGTRGTLLYAVGPSAILPDLDPPPSVPLAGANGVTDVAVTRVATPFTGAAGNWVVAARGNQQVRIYSPAGVLVDFAGSGAVGFADGAAGAATFHDPTAVALDGAGNIWVADQTNHAIRRIDAATGAVTTIAGHSSPRQFAVSCSASCPPAVLGGLQEGAADVDAKFRCPSGIAVDPGATEVLVGDLCNHVVRRLDVANNLVSRYAGSTAGYQDGPALVAKLALPVGVERDAAGTVWVADGGNGRVRRISNGQVTTVGKDETVTLDLFDLSGQGVLPPTVTPAVTHFSAPWGIAVGGIGALDASAKEVLFVSDVGKSPSTGKRIRQIVRAP